MIEHRTIYLQAHSGRIIELDLEQLEAELREHLLKKFKGIVFMQRHAADIARLVANAIWGWTRRAP